jgi:3-deoxy-manno-octulosonate cytidylyltransferase (CMP-KDO synthetase)
VVVLIPARWASTRLPGKPLADLCGRTLVQRVWERARRANCAGRVLVATDDTRIASAVRGFGGEVAMTSPDHASGTDRIAEVARGLDAEIVVNVQGDEPFVDPASIDAAVAPLLGEPELPLSTLACPLRDADEMLRGSVVKVVADRHGDALYFSRAPIPVVRLGVADDARQSAQAAIERGLAWRHLGLYAYRRLALLQLAGLPPAPLELAEGLEQLRALHHGLKMRVVPVAEAPGPAIDTPDDLARVRELLSREEPS